MPLRGPYINLVGNEVLPVTNGVTNDNSVQLHGVGSMRFDGTTGYALATYDNTAHEVHSDSAWTIEATIRPVTAPSGATQQTGFAAVMAKTRAFNQSYYLGISPTRQLGFYYSTDGTGGGIVATLSSANDIPLNTWSRIAFTLSGGTLRLFVEGTQVASRTSVSTFFNTDEFFRIAATNVAGYEYYYDGYIREVRITKGVARYTANYTPSNDPFPAGSSDPNWSNVTFLARGSVFETPLGFYLNPQTGRYSQFLPPALAARGILPVRLVYKRDYGGRGRIYGTVKVKGTPNYAVARPVRLFRDRDAVCLQEVWSDPITGAYEFIGYDMNEKYSVISYDDPSNSFRAVIADNLVPELIP